MDHQQILHDLALTETAAKASALETKVIPTLDQIELAMYGNDVMDLTSSGLRSI